MLGLRCGDKTDSKAALLKARAEFDVLDTWPPEAVVEPVNRLKGAPRIAPRPDQKVAASDSAC